MTTTQVVKVAVVDNDFRVLEALQELLESAGYSVLLFASAQLFLEADSLRDINCLITDIGMPVMDGFELRSLVKNSRPELPVIFITGHHVASDRKRAAAYGHHGFFQKPFDPVALLAAVEQIIP
jgi:FixJ family two-component response regulator